MGEFLSRDDDGHLIVTITDDRGRVLREFDFHCDPPERDTAREST